MPKRKFIIVIVLLGIFGVCLQHSKHRTTASTKSNKIITKKIYYLFVLRDTIDVEDIQLFKNNSLFALMNSK